jgi:hypothetical protein
MENYYRINYTNTNDYIIYIFFYIENDYIISILKEFKLYLLKFEIEISSQN